VYAVFAVDDDRPIGIRYQRFPLNDEFQIWMGRKKSTLSGKIVNARGEPVAGASVMQNSLEGRPIPGILSATTDANGRFAIDKLNDLKLPGGAAQSIHLRVVHPDFPETAGEAPSLAADVKVVLPDGCIVSGSVIDKSTGKPASDALVTVVSRESAEKVVAITNAAGRFRVAVPEGRYDVLVDAEGRVCVALADQECLINEPIELPPLQLIQGGFIYGQVINSATGEAVTATDNGAPITIGLYGPSQPEGRVISPTPRATVDKEGRFILRAPPGDNFPYFVNTRGDRMSWDTLKQPPVVVKEKETTFYKMLITPEVSPEEKLKRARTVVAALPEKPVERTAAILDEFRKLNHTVDETELWCMLMREVVAIGRDAVPQLCAELDRTTENRMLRRLGFALRAIGDRRAVPALIRAIPKTLLPGSSDYGLIVNDAELAAFMQKHDLDKGNGGTHFGFGRPEREIFGALHALSGRDFGDIELFGLSLSEDPRGQVLQRRIYRGLAERWQAWWEANWREFTDESAYRKVDLLVVDEPLPPASGTLGPSARLSGVMSGATLSPAKQEGQYAWHFYDLDTGYRPRWPAEFPRDEARVDAKQVADFAARSGADLMCITHRAPDGTETFVLQALGMKVREISQRDQRNIDRLVAAGKLPEGREVDELLMHYDPESKRFVPDADAAFIFVTREGSMGLIETTDRINQTANLNGMPGAPRGVGFHKGVRFDLKAIIP
jgi:hypothetical protein